MVLPFDREKADFTAMAKPADPNERLYIAKVFHKAFVKVDEEGAEAAAATAVVMGKGERPHLVHGPRYRSNLSATRANLLLVRHEGWRLRSAHRSLSVHACPNSHCHTRCSRAANEPTSSQNPPRQLPNNHGRQRCVGGVRVGWPGGRTVRRRRAARKNARGKSDAKRGQSEVHHGARNYHKRKNNTTSPERVASRACFANSFDANRFQQLRVCLADAND